MGSVVLPEAKLVVIQDFNGTTDGLGLLKDVLSVKRQSRPLHFGVSASHKQGLPILFCDLLFE